MNILVIGAGLMGPAAAFNALRDPAVARVTLADNDPMRLEQAAARLARFDSRDRLETRCVDLADRSAAVALLRQHDAAMSALPWSASLLAFAAALETGVPIVDLAIPDDEEMERLRSRVGDGTVLLGCGLEPGLTEIVARDLASRLDRVEEVHIKVGGIPEHPAPPLGYKIVYGGRELPLRSIPALVITGGDRKLVPRYSGVESTAFTGVGECEAWHEGVLDWLLDHPELKGVREVTQKTIRWPGYAERAMVLNELGLLSTDSIRVGDCDVVPKQLVDTVLYPSVRLGDDEVDLTLFRVDVSGYRGDRYVRLTCQMVDRRDMETGFTSMARTTAFTGAIATRMIGSGEITEHGLLTAETVFFGPRVRMLMDALQAEGIRFETTES